MLIYMFSIPNNHIHIYLNAPTTLVMSVSSSHMSSPITCRPPSRVGTCQSLVAEASGLLSKLEPEINANDET